MDQTANYKSAYAQRLKRNCDRERRLFMHLPFPEKLEATPKSVKWSMEWNDTEHAMCWRFAVICDDESNRISGTQAKMMIC